MSQPWPLGTGLELASYLSAVPCARLHARLVTAEWGLGRLTATTELLVSELVTNAVQVSQRVGGLPPVRLWLHSEGIRVLVMVGDAGSGPPLQMQPAADAESGRGLLLVDALADEWGWYRVEGGKVCWCVVAAPEPLARTVRAGPDNPGRVLAALRQNRRADGPSSPGRHPGVRHDVYPAGSSSQRTNPKRLAAAGL